MSRRLPWIVAAVLALFAALGVFVDRVVLPRQPAEARARWLAESGRVAEAEVLYWTSLQSGRITTESLVAFLDLHARSAGAVILRERELGGDFDGSELTLARVARVDESAVDELLSRGDLPEGTALLGRYWRHALAERRESLFDDAPHARDDVDAQPAVIAAADRDPPLPWANRLLARDAQSRGELDIAVRRFVREATHVPENASDADAALELLMEAGAWDEAALLLEDPRVSRAASAWIQFRVAVERRDLRNAARWSWNATFRRPDPSVLALTIAAGLAWLVICARLGNVRERPQVKLPLYFAALGLGVLSVYPTMLLLAFQESVLHLTEAPDGDMLRDILYYFFGVGFREELSKLLLFLPLYPLIRRLCADGQRCSKIDVLVCGGLVGLGFAAEENLGYFAHGSLATAIARYMTANFAHIAWTAIVCGALDDMVRDGERYTFDFSRTLVTVMAMHGAYDFFLSTRLDGISYFSMALFIVLGRMFLGAIREAHPRVGRGLPVLDVFAVATAAVVGSSFVYACARVGPSAAALFMLEGLLGTFIFAYFFVQEFRRV